MRSSKTREEKLKISNSPPTWAHPRKKNGHVAVHIADEYWNASRKRDIRV
jgi:hypothetical protein